MYICCYFQPEVSQLYKDVELDGFQEVESILTEAIDVDVLLCGDFNANAGDLSDTTQYNS